MSSDKRELSYQAIAMGVIPMAAQQAVSAVAVAGGTVSVTNQSALVNAALLGVTGLGALAMAVQRRDNAEDVIDAVVGAVLNRVSVSDLRGGGGDGGDEDGEGDEDQTGRENDSGSDSNVMP